jgi:hypothetical protein
VTAGNGRDNAAGGLTPRFLELKRLVLRMKREQPQFHSCLDKLAAATAFVLTGGDHLSFDAMPAAATAVLDRTLMLPCSPCLFEVVGRDMPAVVQCDYLEDGVWRILPWIRDGWKAWDPWFFGIYYHPGGEKMQYSIVKGCTCCDDTEDVDKHRDELQDMTELTLLAAYACTQGLSAATAETRAASAATRALMHSRGITGWQYKLLTLVPEPRPAGPRTPLGGTHAPPRWHLRRAHVRHLKNGKVVPVRSCEVGTAERGGVVKDYRLPEDPPPS